MAATLPRELIKWLQSLDLTHPIQTPKWDLANGYLVAEIFSWYYPKQIENYLLLTGSGIELRKTNWHVLKTFMKRKEIPIPLEYADAVMHCKNGAAEVFLQAMYEFLTNRRLKVVKADPEIDFTDFPYQSRLPPHAQSTAIVAIRNNLKSSELNVIGDVGCIAAKRLLSQAVVNRHVDIRRAARQRDPSRYDHQPTLGELAPRRSPPPEMCNTGGDDSDNARYFNDSSNTLDDSRNTKKKNERKRKK